MPFVAPASFPRLPDWIKNITPTGDAGTLAQIRVDFAKPLLPVERIGSPDQAVVLSHFAVEPELAGRFRFLTPRMVGFQADRALPAATRIRVTLREGLANLAGDRLDHDISWTFQTRPIDLVLPEGTQDSLQPALTIYASTELDLESLRSHFSFAPHGGGTSIPVTISASPEDISNLDENAPQKRFDPTVSSWKYVARPSHQLPKATSFDVVVLAGLSAAHGNLPTTHVFRARVSTFSPLTIHIEHYYENGKPLYRFTNGDPLLVPNNALVPQSVLRNATLEPAPLPSRPALFTGIDPWGVSLNPDALTAQTSYTLTLGDVTDVYKQKLGKKLVLTFKTNDYLPSFSAPESFMVVPPNGPQTLRMSAVNLPESTYYSSYHVYRPADLIQQPVLYGWAWGINLNSLLSDPSTWRAHGVHARRNATAVISVPLAPIIGAPSGIVLYGVGAKIHDIEEQPDDVPRALYGAAELTNLGVFAQWFPSSGLIMVHHLTDGSPAIAVPVDVFALKGDGVPCLRSRTDANGALTLNAHDLQTCMGSAAGFNESPHLLTIAREGSDWGFARIDGFDYNSGYGWRDWSDRIPTGTIFTDRQLYQPGEVAYLTGVAYYLRRGVLGRASRERFQLTLEGPNYAKTDLGTIQTDDAGFFSRKVALQPHEPVGNYSVSARAADGLEINGNFDVEEFKPPNFKVTLRVTPSIAYPGDQVTTLTKSSYLFGAPVVNAESMLYAKPTLVNPHPRGRDDFWFGPDASWIYQNDYPPPPKRAAKIQSSTNASGESTQSLRIPTDLPYPTEYDLSSVTKDSSNQTVSDAGTVLALPSTKLIGVQTDFIAEADKPFAIRLIVTDAHGRALAGVRVSLALQSASYQYNNGGSPSVNYTTVARTVVVSRDRPITATLTPPEGGDFRIRANLAIAQSTAAATDTHIWAGGNVLEQWVNAGPQDQIAVQLDRKKYRVGQVATALIQSPYKHATLYFAVVRGKVLLQQIVQTETRGPIVRFVVTREMLPNALVEAVLVRCGAASQGDSGVHDNLPLRGFAPLTVDPIGKYLHVSVVPQRRTLAPGATQVLDMRVTDASGRPVRGNFTVLVVNENILQLTGYRPPDLVSIVYRDQPVATTYGDNLSSFERMRTLGHVTVRGTASLLSRSVTADMYVPAPVATTAPNAPGQQPHVRANFQELAGYRYVSSDEHGHARIEFTLPDDLTTWRAMVVAAAAKGSSSSTDFYSGNGEATFRTTKPLLANPLLPQFVRPGDRFTAGLSVTNNSQATGQLDIVGLLMGPLAFVNGPTPSQNYAASEPLKHDTQAYRVPMLAQGSGTGSLRFTVRTSTQGDSFEVPLAAEALEVTEQAVETGATTSSVSIRVDVGHDVAPDAGGLDLVMASSLVADIVAPAKTALYENDWPFLEPLASRIAIASDMELLSRRYGRNIGGIDASALAESNYSLVTKLRYYDGGFVDWPGAHSSDPIESAYLAQCLGRMRKAGFSFPIDADLEPKLETFLERVLDDPQSYFQYPLSPQSSAVVRLSMLRGMAALGHRRSDHLGEIFAVHDDFDFVTQVRLARYMHEFPEFRPEGTLLSDDLEKNIYVTGRRATVNIPEQWAWFDSPTTLQAEALGLFVTQGRDPEFLDRVLQSLLALRHKGDWGNSYDNAEALGAIVDYSMLEATPPDFSTRATLAGSTLVSTNFAGFANAVQTTHVPMRQLPNGRNNVVLEKSGQGTLHYVVAYQYRLLDPQPGVLNGIRVTRDIRLASQEAILDEIGFNIPATSIALAVGQTYDVGLEIITDHPIDHVMITDPLPAGFEPVHSSFRISTSYFQSQPNSWEVDYTDIHRNKIFAFAQYLDTGVHTIHYLVQSVTPGMYLWPGAEAHLQYVPEEFGRTASATLRIY